MKPTGSDDALSRSLAVAHTAVNDRHTDARNRLLAILPDVAISRGSALAGARRYVIGGMGAGVLAATALLMIWLLSSTTPALAMERMGEALQRVNSYSFRMESVHVSRKQRGRTVRQVTVGEWRTRPLGLHARFDIVETLGTNTPAPDAPQQLVDIEETHQAGRRGILIDHLKKHYWRINEEVDADSIGNLQVVIYMVRQRRGRALRDLGTKQINGQAARGLVIVLDDAHIESDLGPVTSAGDEYLQPQSWAWRDLEIETWIDPKTNLPLEFRCVRCGDDFKTTNRFTDLKWNVEFAAEAFEPTAPAGYKELDGAPWAE